MLGCGTGTGTVSINLTDAPVDSNAVESVFITVTGIAYHIGESEDWTKVSSFGDPQSYDLLSLTGGVFEALGDFQIPAGKITQLRFFLEAPETGSGQQANPGCYIKLTGDETKYPLFVPSGSESGFKATGSFDVPLNGTVSVTADFDVRKSVKKTGSTYNLQPTIRTIADGEAGKINGSVTYSGTNTLVVFAYMDGTYSSSEFTSDPPFSGAVTSAVVTDDASYVLPFLAAGIYDLVYLEMDAEGDYLTSVVAEVSDVEVLSSTITAQNLIF
jgi:hypothetical protein